MNICIYGASSSIIAGAYINPVEELGARLAKRGHTLVFGGGKYGLMGAAVRGVKAAGGRAIPLKVRGAFHSPFMNGAAAAFARELETVEIGKNAVPLYSNMTAEPYTQDAASLLSGQICSPVLWERLIRNMIESGIDTFVEIGPGKTLTNMVKKINPEMTALSAQEYLTEVEAC